MNCIESEVSLKLPATCQRISVCENKPALTLRALAIERASS
jgi:hypothetical protein